MNDFEVVVVGAGVAGLVAGLTAGRHGLEVLVVDQLGVGGQVLNVESVDEYPGFPDGVAGFELGPLLHTQAEAAGARFRLDTIQAVEPAGQGWTVRGAAEPYGARAVILACGSAPRSLGVPGESSLVGRGISHCASCDGPLYAGREVCVVGGGDSAVQEAATLADQVERVTVIFEGEALGAQQALQSRLAGKPNVELRPASTVQEVLGDGAVSGVRVASVVDGSESTLEVAGVFVYVGLEPSSSWVAGLVQLDGGGHIETDLMMQTSRPGIFAAGDVRSRSVSQLAAVAGDGATAAVAAARYLRIEGR